MAEQKVDDSMNKSLQYPSRNDKPASSKPNPSNDKLPKIATPNEVELPFNEGDWEMFRKIKAKYGSRLDVFYGDDLTRFVQGYSHEKEREIETFKRIDELLKRGFEPEKYKDAKETKEDPCAKQFDFKQILEKDAMKAGEEEDALKAWPVFMYGYDDQGHPVMYDEIGNSNPTDLDACFEDNEANMKAGKFEKMRKLKTFRFRVLRRLHNTKRIQTGRYGYDGSVNDKGGLNAITKHCIVMDIKNFHAKSLTAKYRNLVKDIIADESNLWPNTLEKMYIINAPWPFRFAWKIISNFIHPITVAKIDILGSDYINTMKKKISLDQIPKAYGGTCELPIKYGYTADIDNDILDGDYCTMGDPLDLDNVPCLKNKDKLANKSQEQKPNIDDDDAKDDKENKDKTEKASSGSDDSYVKVKSDANETDKK